MADTTDSTMAEASQPTSNETTLPVRPAEKSGGDGDKPPSKNRCATCGKYHFGACHQCSTCKGRHPEFLRPCKHCKKCAAHSEDECPKLTKASRGRGGNRGGRGGFGRGGGGSAPAPAPVAGQYVAFHPPDAAAAWNMVAVLVGAQTYEQVSAAPRGGNVAGRGGITKKKKKKRGQKATDSKDGGPSDSVKKENGKGPDPGPNAGGAGVSASA